MTTIALVDDDRNILMSVSILFENEGYNVRTYKDGVSALSALTAAPADLVILDIKMPRMDGMEVLKRLHQKKPSLPVIFLTSKDEEIDEIIGLGLGADDFIRKPFSQRLLLGRVRAVLRRAEPVKAGDDTEDDDKPMVRGELVLYPMRYLCTWRGTPVSLTVTEFLILEALARRPGYVKSRDQLMDEAYPDHIHVGDRTIDSHIKRLRKKFKEVDADYDAIETKYGVGYRYREVQRPGEAG